MKRLGGDYESLRTINSKLVYCSLTGYGQKSPYGNLPSHDINYISVAGALGNEELADAQDTREEKVIEDAFSYFRDTFVSKTRDEWFEILGQHEISVSKVNSLDEVLTDPHLLACPQNISHWSGEYSRHQQARGQYIILVITSKRHLLRRVKV